MSASEDWMMSEAERDALSEQIAQRVVNGLLRASTDDEQVDKVVNTFTKQFTLAIGRAVIRAVVILVAAGMVLGAAKTGFLQWISEQVGRR